MAYKKSKTRQRVSFLKDMLNFLLDDNLWNKFGYKTSDEDKIKAYLRPKLEEKLKKYLENKKGLPEKKAAKKLNGIFRVESDPTCKLKNFEFFGVRHRPDFELRCDNIRVALEIKKIRNGQSIREGIGQGIVYTTSNEYDFVICLMLDITKDSTVCKSIGEKEKDIIKNLWKQFNIVLVFYGDLKNYKHVRKDCRTAFNEIVFN